ncbi:hypothetical protein AGMMS49983_22030 [Clostridia bacterium]|nr:hypothetical protein AGMMS49983_22030 [Clostridia bacterium]
MEDPFTVHEAAVPLAAPSSPATGDESAPLGWLLLMMFSALALLTVVRKARLVN